MQHKRAYKWAASGDLSAFLGLTFDNVAQLIVFSSLLIGLFHYPPDLVLRRMLPGTAMGVLVGDLLYTWLAFRLARRTGRTDVTAMPLGIDTPSLFGLTFGVLGPCYLLTHDAELSFGVGTAVLLMMGLFKVAASFFADRLRDLLPPAALLGTIGAVGVLMISFLQVPKLIEVPLVGLPALLFVLLSFFRPLRLPGRFLRQVPVVLVGVALCTAAYYALSFWGIVPPQGESAPQAAGLGLGLSCPWPAGKLFQGLHLALSYLPIALPLACVTVIGGIDNTASAAAAGDEYDTRSVLLVEGVSTLVAALLGGVVQTTPYIGHPAYKRMGGRAGYTLGTALFVGLGGIFGYLAWMVHVLPEVVVAPILVFIGLEITSQAFHLVPQKQGPAVALSFLPVIANLVLILGNQWLSAAGGKVDLMQGPAQQSFFAVQLLSNGFVFTSLLWGAALAFILDGRLFQAAMSLLVCALASCFGLIHSPLPGGALLLPWKVASRMPYLLMGGYLLAAGVVLLLRLLPEQREIPH